TSWQPSAPCWWLRSFWPGAWPAGKGRPIRKQKRKGEPRGSPCCLLKGEFHLHCGADFHINGADGGPGLGIGTEGHSPHHGSVGAVRSEEHTSELQSRENLVCRLLLEKKNN